jgi:hypothetical protein
MKQKFAATSNRVGWLNSQAMKTVRQSRCINIQKFHAFYGLLYPKLLQDTPDVLNRVEVELNNFMIPETWWWKGCLDIPTQSARLGFVADVVLHIKMEEDVLDLYRTIDALFEVCARGCSYGVSRG